MPSWWIATPAWVRYGIVAGVVAFAATLVADLSVLWLRPADLCRAGPPILFLASLVALLVFLLLAVAAGFATGRSTGVMSQALLAGLVVGAISGCALVATTPFISRATQRFQDLSAACPHTPSFTRSFSFHFGPTPPPGVLASPPSGFFGETPPGGFPTPPPGAFTTPPPEAFAPPSGFAALVLDAIGLMFRIGFGMGFAVAAAAFGGALGAATRRR